MEEGVSSSIKLCATECALRRMTKRCRCQVGSEQCFVCDLYVEHYTDSRQARSFLIQAEYRAALMKQSARGIESFASWCWRIVAIIIVFIIVGWVISNKQLTTYSATEPTATAAVEAKLGVTERPKDTSSSHQKILWTLEQVDNWMRHGTDVNHDGDVSCIDAAVLFYQYYPDKTKVTITVNHHPTNGMYHAFNTVLLDDGRSMAVEPQAIYSRYSKYFVQDIWPEYYDPKYNRDALEQYIVYVKQ